MADGRRTQCQQDGISGRWAHRVSRAPPERQIDAIDKQTDVMTHERHDRNDVAILIIEDAITG